MIVQQEKISPTLKESNHLHQKQINSKMAATKSSGT